LQLSIKNCAAKGVGDKRTFTTWMFVDLEFCQQYLGPPIVYCARSRKRLLSQFLKAFS
jgi:hypothetical protein